MNEKNLEYLLNNLKYLGFGDKLNDALNEALSRKNDSFKLETSSLMPLPNQKDNPKVGDKIIYDISFSKGKENDLYFLNSYKAELQKYCNKDVVSQCFYVNKGKGVTAKEAYNLLSGRAVNKDIVLKSGEKANVWLKLDLQAEKEKGNHLLKSFGEKYGFNLNKSIDNSLIKGLENPETKERLIKSLEKGNQHEVTFQKNGVEVKGFVSANPQYKTLDFADAELKPVYSKSVDAKNVVDEKALKAKSNLEAKAMEKAINKAIAVGAITCVDVSEGKGYYEMNGKKIPGIIQIMNNLKTPDAVNKLISDFEKSRVSNEVSAEPQKSRGR
ncbi:hypothetical protein FA048_12790 [Pedobacter polaris]|uniref:DUF3945 domain-containing protein n=1 Tax=Pedobacter polaris TaxID=2571273 RepID=A0A4U1CK63_9SPHI|nr:hypothetical protein [Pedobacter polaris]TKC08034.1 hypothetical protein FA048_12790 [Pedobacter polaris]